MKAINANTVQKLVTTVNLGLTNAFQAKESAVTLKTAFAELHDRNEAANLAREIMVQAILQGLAGIIITDGKRNDKASNWKRNLATAVNGAYDDQATRFSLKTSGKGNDRTVIIEYTKKPAEKDARGKFEDKLGKLLEEVNTTEAEQKSIVANLLGLFDAEQGRLAGLKVAAEVRAEEARLNAAAAVTARVSEQLEKAGIKPTAHNIEVALAMAQG